METGLYYYGARYLDAKTSRWLSTDPALGEYIPGAPINDEVKKANQNLPGMGGVFNYVNMHLYRYAGNNPIKYTDPNGMADELTDAQWNTVKQDLEATIANLDNMIQALSDFDAGNIDSLSSDFMSAANDFLGVDFSLPLDATMLGIYLGEIKDSLASMTKKDFRFDSKTTSYAYTNPFSGKITLGDKYFNATNQGNDTRQGILIHEKTHKFTVLFTNDRAYGVDDVLLLRSDNRVNHKSRNADNWEYFYERIITGGR